MMSTPFNNILPMHGLDDAAQGLTHAEEECFRGKREELLSMELGDTPPNGMQEDDEQFRQQRTNLNQCI